MLASATKSAVRAAGTVVVVASKAGMASEPAVTAAGAVALLQAGRMVETYRRDGHVAAKLNPLPLDLERPGMSAPALALDSYALDGSESIPVKGLLTFPDGREMATTAQIQEHLAATYTRTLGVEFSHLSDEKERAWIARALESTPADAVPDAAYRKTLLQMLTQSEHFDLFMAKKHPGVKRYGLEGAESMLAAVDAVFRTVAGAGGKDVVIGMPHRGRLNLLATILGYPARNIFRKVSGEGGLFPEGDWFASDDVTSHIAHSVDIPYPEGSLHVSLLNNPSHLEAGNPVSMGKTRAKQALNGSDSAVCLQIHGDAAFAGQGVVHETLLLANLPGFTVGGSVHMIVNNQLGFTAGAKEGRSSPYSSDVGKIIGAPVFHVNGDDPEAVVRAAALATAYRNVFKKDAIIDIIAYRRHGHNELDEPMFTQPVMYKSIKAQTTVAKSYADRLIAAGVVSAPDVKVMGAEFTKFLDTENKAPTHVDPAAVFSGAWSHIRQGKAGEGNSASDPSTGYSKERLLAIGKASVTLPDDVDVHDRLVKSHMTARLSKLEEGTSLDWATAEALAFGSLLEDSAGPFNIRMSGQDVVRGTFSHRHSEITCGSTEKRVQPLAAISEPHGTFFEPINSPLSEFAVLGFEYGYSLEHPNTLPIWEAQFGDFANGAQIMIDAFITSSETKWLRQTALTMLLPHGFDGAGPEHSSARIERYLTTVDDPFDGSEVGAWNRPTNITVAHPSTPASYFHLLRRQMLRPWRAPLVVIGPKTLLRLPSAVSSIDEMAEGTSFSPVLDDPSTSDRAGDVKRVVFTSGRLYYELANARAAAGKDNGSIAIVRLEQLAPFPHEEVARVLSTYSNAESHVWAQEEGMNAGAYAFVEPRLRNYHNVSVDYVGRPPLAAPAVSNGKRHAAEASAIIEGALDL